MGSKSRTLNRSTEPIFTSTKRKRFINIHSSCVKRCSMWWKAVENGRCGCYGTVGKSHYHKEPCCYCCWWWWWREGTFSNANIEPYRQLGPEGGMDRTVGDCVDSSKRHRHFWGWIFHLPWGTMLLLRWCWWWWWETCVGCTWVMLSQHIQARQIQVWSVLIG